MRDRLECFGAESLGSAAANASSAPLPKDWNVKGRPIVVVGVCRNEWFDWVRLADDSDYLLNQLFLLIFNATLFRAQNETMPSPRSEMRQMNP